MANLNERMVALGTSRSVIRELFEFGKQRAAEIGAENVFDFSIGNPSVPAPDAVNETAIKLLQDTDPVVIHGYTSAQGDIEVRKLLADSVNRRFDTSFGPDNFYVSVGAAAALCCCLNGLCNKDDEVIVFAPYFPEYKVFIEGAGAKMNLIPADTEAFQIDFEKFEAAINENTKAVIVNSPNNPCGVVYSHETCTKLAEILNAKSAELGHPIYLIADEPYREIVFDGIEVPYLPKYYNNTLVCYSWSKSLSLPGERLGYVLVPDEVEEHGLVYAAVAGAGRSLGYVNAPGLFQRVCAMCADMTADITIYETNRNLLYNGLREIGFDVVKPDGTFYIFPKTLEEDDVAFCERAKQFNILIVPGSGFGCPGHARISYCVPTERIERALDAFKKLADSYK
ncbi:pyridoxal phosphate-dependent aminotransferase [bacterium]|uniref:pyridoxal phosphate-dependent aminotransferase n=1 Tax=Lachnospiraceae TaxID=186803 RepID=UPI002A767E06|nr:pyridoxal phosphate-dependent aminotransferase [bacterium]MCI7150094.1 pyridoxal phosphate-dependent aminotransferase [bacterium]MDY2886594.1 pyridoxal phosphate-dependent aminotransferase [Bariatricus sp.]MDY4192755.1 pyridoxal phosphate-dependent aminotransferase [Bariatricus sp.]MDY4503176.1 pyridoxal phosphate-dependent aminotransferase [Bariatricus sp.]